MSMNDTTDSKPWWTSTTIQGGIISFLSAAAPIITNVLHIDIGDPAKLVSAAFTLIGFVMVIVGRGKADKAIR
jgi:hypothetical protein